MIFATVGLQLPFPRLIQALDELGPGLPEKIIAQTGPVAYPPRNIEHFESIAPNEFEALFRNARVIVSHAGIGTIITAKKFAKPIILFPRRASLKEHRNDHQSASANQLRHHQGVYVAWEKDELERLLSSELEAPGWAEGAPLVRLHQHIGQFIKEIIIRPPMA